MADPGVHGAFVNAWLAAAAKGLSPEQQLRLLEDAFHAVWQRAHDILGDVTLTAIADRVFYDAAERHPWLSGLEVGPTGLQFEGLHERSRGLPPARIADAIQAVLVEFLSVLGNLTAEILTPGLHVALSGVRPAGARAEGTGGEDVSS